MRYPSQYQTTQQTSFHLPFRYLSESSPPAPQQLTGMSTARKQPIYSTHEYGTFVYHKTSCIIHSPPSHVPPAAPVHPPNHHRICISIAPPLSSAPGILPPLPF